MIIAGILMFLMVGQSVAAVKAVLGALPSGTVVILVEDHRIPMISSEIRYALPLLAEPDVGMAHWVEHLAFRQGGGLPDGEFDRRIEREGGETNGWTNQDWMALTLDMPASGLDVVLEMELARLSGLTKGLTEEVLSAERAVVDSEFEKRMADARFVDSRVIGRLLYPTSHPYHWSPIENPNQESVNVSRIQEYESRALLPAQAVWVLVGDFDSNYVWSALSLREGHAWDHAPAMDLALDTDREVGGQRFHWIDQRATASMYLVWQVECETPEDFEVAQWAAAALGLGPGGLLDRVLAKRGHVETRVQSRVVRRRHSIEFRIEIQNLNRPFRVTLNRVDRVLKRVAEGGLSNKEAKQAQAWLKWQAESNGSSFAAIAADYAEHWLVGGLAPDSPSFELSTSDGVSGFVQEHLGPSRLVLTVSPNAKTKPLRFSQAVEGP